VLKFGGSGVLSMRAYFSTYHLWAAEHFSKLAGEIEDSHKGKSKFNLEHRAYVMNSILSSVAFLEAAINELFQDAHDNHESYIKNLDKQLLTKMAAVWQVTEHDNKKKFGTLEKYQIALEFAGIEKFKPGENPLQDVQLVIKLRNELTHYKPMNLDEKNKHSLEKKLLGSNFAPNKLMEGSGNNFFPDHALGAGCTGWCFKSVKNFTDEFFSRMDIKPNY